MQGIKDLAKIQITFIHGKGLHFIIKRVNPLILGVCSYRKSVKIKNKKLTLGYTCNILTVATYINRFPYFYDILQDTLKETD